MKLCNMKQSQPNSGSLRKRETTQPQQNTEYYLFNSQGNLKAYSDDVMSFAYYGYNAANTRTYKLSLYNTNLWINGQQQPLNLQLQNAMFYPNTYLNFDAFGNYTKHYYNGMERIASRLGDNSVFIGFDCNDVLESHRVQLEEKFREELQDLIFETVPIDLPPFIDVNALQPTGTPNDIYYYHPNHLGSTSFVTDQNQTITQGFLYAPFGEITTEYNVNFGSSVIPKYSFNAKELDEETGMYYYEARYYKPPVFTSRDPLFEKYFWMSPYAYCANNPVKYVDPSGEEMTDFQDKNGNLIKHIDDGSNAVFRKTGEGSSVHYAFVGYNKQGGKDRVNYTSAIQEQQQLNMENPSLQQTVSGTTYCNYATQNIMNTLESTPKGLNALVKGTANDMVSAMMNGDSPCYEKCTYDEAKAYAENGGLAIVGYKNPDGGHGHVATFSVGDNIEKGEIANIGPTKYTGYRKLKDVIANEKEKHYFIFKPLQVITVKGIKVTPK